MIEIIKDLLVLVGVPGALITAWKAIREFRNSNAEKAKATAEKARENRHKQAAAGRDALREIFSSERSRTAMQMLDWSGRSIPDGKGSHVVRFQDLGPAMRVENLAFSPKERFIRDCFEDLFDRLELLYHFIEIEFLNFGDVAVPLRYYAQRIVDKNEDFFPFLEHYGYPKTKAFLLRVTA